jgi:hypothetical protein
MRTPARGMRKGCDREGSSLEKQRVAIDKSRMPKKEKAVQKIDRKVR